MEPAWGLPLASVVTKSRAAVAKYTAAATDGGRDIEIPLDVFGALKTQGGRACHQDDLKEAPSHAEGTLGRQATAAGHMRGSSLKTDLKTG